MSSTGTRCSGTLAPALPLSRVCMESRCRCLPGPLIYSAKANAFDSLLHYLLFLLIGLVQIGHADFSEARVEIGLD